MAKQKVEKAGADENQDVSATTNSALILSGGGARAAYQVGVLKALAELTPPDRPNPFNIICGTSAGAVNAMFLAGYDGDFKASVEHLCSLWLNITADQIYRTEWYNVVGNLLSFSGSLLHRGIGRGRPLAMLNNSPFREFVFEKLDFGVIQRKIDSGIIRALCVNAMSYSEGESVSFFQGGPDLKEWRRFRRYGVRARLNIDHLMASLAIPTVFPTVKIGSEYFGDGAVRQLAPISPALHLGADRIFVVGVSDNRSPVHWGKQRLRPKHSPSIAQIGGHLFNAAFIDSLEGDLEHLERVNHLLEAAEEKGGNLDTPLRPVETAVIEPSQSLEDIAARKVQHLAGILRFIFRATGGTNTGGGASPASYLLFERPFTSELIDLGYQDAMWAQDSLRHFLRPPEQKEEPRKTFFGLRRKTVTEDADENPT